MSSQLVYVITLYNSDNDGKRMILLDGSEYTEEQVKNHFGHYVYALAMESEDPIDGASVDTESESSWWPGIMHGIIQYSSHHYELWLEKVELPSEFVSMTSEETKPLSAQENALFGY